LSSPEASGPVTDVDNFVALLDLTRAADATWLGATPRGSERPNLYGGLVAAQALRAAHLSVPAGFDPHSVHSLFLRAGRFDEPVHFDVDVTRNGRSFLARRVEARQSGGVILSMLASFQHPEQGDSYQLSGPDTALPADDAPRVATGMETGMGGDGPFELVNAEPGDRRDGSLEWSAVRYWARARSPLPTDAGIHACALVAMGDLRTGTPPRVARAADAPVQMTTLDYSLWLHRATPADEWILFDLRAAGNGGARGLTYGVVFDAGHRQVASLAMELLLRDQPDRA
jgi:acyl-CoA thioesterase II